MPGARRSLTHREKVLVACLAALTAVLVWDTARRHWSPTVTVTTDHYTVYSTATAEQTRRIGRVAEMLHAAYADFLSSLLVQPQKHGTLRIKLFKDRDEFRFCNRIYSWMEGFYRRPYCYQYYPEEERNPYHWMVHEATHQLNAEVAGFRVAHWMEEGIAEYFGTSQIVSNRLMLGEIDTNTYPVWWLDSLAILGDLEADKSATNVIPLRVIVSDSGGPDIDEFFNLYYLHWWSLMHFLMRYENGRYRGAVARLVRTNGGVEAFERYVGDVGRVEREWYGYVLALKHEFALRMTPPVRLAEDGWSPDPQRR